MKQRQVKGLADDAMAAVLFEPLQVPVEGVAGASDDGTDEAERSNGWGERYRDRVSGGQEGRSLECVRD